MQNSFGISGAQAASSQKNYSPYTAESGIKDVGLSASVSHAVTDHISVMLGAKYARLLGDAADSPLVDQEGDANQLQGMLGLIYRW
jgi:outer membrane scaffolding protein for murein synthesis (MipA/OmpV family)